MKLEFKDFVSFDRMISPIIIKILFWIGVGISILAGIGVFFGGIINGIMYGDFGQILGSLVGGPLTIIVGILITRVYAELLIVLFQVNDSLTDIKKKLQQDD